LGCGAATGSFAATPTAIKTMKMDARRGRMLASPPRWRRLDIIVVVVVMRQKSNFDFSMRYCTISKILFLVEVTSPKLRGSVE
jgi:hypothetical protein